MISENGFRRWDECSFGQQYGIFVGDEAGRELNEAGYIENYACENIHVVNSDKFPMEAIQEGPNYIYLAQLSPGGYITDAKVHEALNYSCLDCPYFKSRRLL